MLLITKHMETMSMAAYTNVIYRLRFFGCFKPGSAFTLGTFGAQAWLQIFEASALKA